MFWGHIHRMILVELLKIFSIALVALTSLILMAGIIAEAMKNGLSPTQIAWAIPRLLPSMLPYTMPTTTLFATCIVYGRLSADNEILALKAAGIHIVHVIWPAIFLGLVASAITMALYVNVIPETHHSMKTMVVGDVEELLYTMLRKDGYIKHAKISYEIHVKGVQGRQLQEVLFMQRAANGNGYEVIAKSKEAELRVDLAHKKIHVRMVRCQIVQGKNVGMVDAQSWPVDLPPDFPGKTEKYRTTDMTWTELGEFEEKVLGEKEELSNKIAKHEVALLQAKGEPHVDEHLRNLINERRNRDALLSSIESERHMRPTLALGCLCFALIGCPVGIWLSKSDYLSAFVTCFLPIVTIYYPLLLSMINLSRSGKLPPLIGVHLANVLILTAGLYLFRRLARN